MNSHGRVDTASANKDLTEQIVVVKTEIALLQRKKRLLLEELHRQYLDGEIEPKKRIKMVNDRLKKRSESQTTAASSSKSS
jgi:hypothetical protein